jgi:ribosomal protein L30/L7E
MHTNFRPSSDSKALARRLEATQIGEIVSYDELTKLIAEDVTKVGRGTLQTARRIVQRDHRIVFDVVRGVGLKRLNSVEIVDQSDQTRERIRRTASRGARSLTCADYDALPQEKKAKHNISAALLGAISEYASDKKFKSVESRLNSDGRLLNAGIDLI